MQDALQIWSLRAPFQMFGCAEPHRESRGSYGPVDLAVTRHDRAVHYLIRSAIRCD